LINPAGANMLGIWPAETVIGRKFKEFVHEDFHALVDGGLEALTDRTTRLPLRLRRVGGADVDVELAALRYQDESDAIAGAGAVMLMARDVSERNRALLQLAQREEHIRRIMDTVVEGIVTFDEKGNIETANPSSEQIFGYPAGSLIGTKAASLLGPSVRDYYIAELIRYSKTGSSEIIGRSRDTIGMRADGTVIDLVLSISTLSFGGRRLFISAIHDNTKRKQAERRLFEMATLDPLTKMPNRNVRNARLEGAIVRLQETGGRMAVMFLDLDNFKIINDALGHTVGDDVIRMAGARLRDIVGDYGLVAHLGGDEFSIIVDEPIPEIELETLPQRLLSAIAEPVDI
jgi:PAS domain S-box-containing protein